MRTMASRVSSARARKNRSTSGEGATRSVMGAIRHLEIDASNKFESNCFDIIEGLSSRCQVDHAAPDEASPPLCVSAHKQQRVWEGDAAGPLPTRAYRPQQPSSPHAPFEASASSLPLVVGTAGVRGSATAGMVTWTKALAS